MTHHFLVLHFGAQCPWQPWAVEQARQAAQYLNGRIEIIDVTRRPDLAALHRLFFPFMTVINGSVRLPSPVRAEELVRIATQGFHPPPLAPLLKQPEARAEAIRPLAAADLPSACHLCIPPGKDCGCRSKILWAGRDACPLPPT